MTPDYKNRMEGVVNFKNLEAMKALLNCLKDEWLKDGFEKEDVKEYLSNLV